MKKALISLCLLYPFSLLAQTLDSLVSPPAGGNPDPGAAIQTYSPGKSIWQNPELLSSWAILLIGGIIIGIVIFAKPMQRLSQDLHVKLIIVVMAVVASMYLIAAGWNSEQTAPAFGLLGAIVGYILGKSDTAPKDSKDT